MAGQAGYFRVPMDAARFLVEQSDGPNLLAAYMTLWSFAFGHGSTRDRTAAGAKAVRTALGCTDYQAKRTLRDLLALRGGERGDSALLVRMSDWNAANATHHPTQKANADIYMLPKWGDGCAFVPSLLVRTKAAKSPLARLCQCDALPEDKRDALYALLYLYQVVDYANYMGSPPEDFIESRWLLDGCASVGNYDLELGRIGEHAGITFWFVKEGDERSGKWRVIEALFGDKSEASSRRFFQANDLLDNLGLITRVVIVRAQGGSYPAYPLWVFSPAYRDALAGMGIAGDLGYGMYGAATSAFDLDPDDDLISAVTGQEEGSWGTGLFVCATLARKPPTVVTTRCPRFHAPTPQNLAGLFEMAQVTQTWRTRIKQAKAKARAA